MIDVVDGLDLSGVPIPFLEAYPFPAFALSVPVSSRVSRPKLLSRDTDITVRYYDEVSPLSGPPVRGGSSIAITWSNERWLRVTEGRSLDICLSSRVHNTLQEWIEEDDEVESVFVLDMANPAITLHLTKTVLPLTPPSSTHAFCIVTSQYRPQNQPSAELSSPTMRSSMSSDFQSSFSTQRPSSDYRASMSTDASMNSDSTEGYFPPSERSGSSRSRYRTRVQKEKESVNLANMITAAEESWALLESFDWTTTKLGPTSGWVEAIGPLLSVTFQSKTMDSLWLGEDLVMIYNKAYSVLVDHPASFGQPGSKVWAQLWDYLEPFTKTVLAGTPTYKEDDLIFYTKHSGDYDLETYFTWRYVPIVTRDNKTIGMYNQATITTEKVLSERRLATVREMSDSMLVSRSTREYYDAIADVFDQNPRDAPFALCYSITQKDVPSNGNGTVVEAKYESSIGVPEGHASRPDTLSITLPTKNRHLLGPNADRLSSPTLSAISALSSGSGRHYLSSNGISWPLQKALSTRQCVIVEDCQDLIQGYPIRAWDELPYAAVVIPICSDNSTELPESVLILGLNPKRPLDADYDNWIHLIRSQLASSLVSVKAHEAEQLRLDAMVRMEKAKNAWFRGAAHDLRSPLTLVAGPLEDLLNSQVTPAQKHHLTTAKRNVDRLLRLVNSLLDFSRLEAGRVEGRFVPVNFGEWVSELAEVFQTPVERMGLSYHVDIQPYNQLVYIDPTLFETVVSNLIGNALKYTESGSITVRVRFNDHAEISIIDTGVGIPADELPQVTDWFHRASTAIHAGTQGTGLGLALAKELIRLHDGELIVESCTARESGGRHGSVFTARIPLSARITVEPVDAPKFGAYGKAVAKEAMRWNYNGGGTDASSDTGDLDSTLDTSSRLSDGLLFETADILLVVDDNPDMRQYIKGIFRRHCTVMEASNGEEALAIVQKVRPHLILSDVMMPKMGGMELLARLREDINLRLVPVILLSAMQGDDSRVDALMMGAEDYMEKPFRPKELLARVHLHLQVGKKRWHLEEGFAQREAQISILSDYCPSGIMRASKDGRLTYGNAAWRTMAGMADDEDPDEWPRYVTPESYQSLITPWMEYINGNERELRLNWRWLTGVAVEAIFIRLDKYGSNMTGVLGCISDVTYQEERIRDAEERRREAEESRQQQELLIDLTSHEIRTPVSAILQCSSLVKENLIALKEQLKWHKDIGFKPTKELLHDLDEDVEALESIYQCGLVQERIAGDVLSLARIQLDMLSLYDVEMDLKKEARKILSVFASEGKMKQIDLELKFGASLEMARVAGIKTDPVRLGQVITNLISNAIRFTASSNVRRITTTYDISFVPPAEGTCALPSSIAIPDRLPPTEDTPIWLFVSVTDTGPGLGPDQLAMLFKRFSQGNKMIHTQYGGSGLGLFICRKITEMLGGRIEVQSMLGQGSTFRFFIQTRTISPPSAIAAMVEASHLARPVPQHSDSANSGSVTPAISLSSNTSMGSMHDDDWTEQHILIVEDNIINQTVLKRQLVKAGLTCDVANNGLEALNLIREADRQAKRGGTNRKKRYNAVLMDLEMPVMDGLTAVREIRTAEAAGTLMRNMVIALTGNARQGQIDQALEAGMDDVVIKPYVLKNLLHKIRAMGLKRTELEMDDMF